MCLKTCHNIYQRTVSTRMCCRLHSSTGFSQAAKPRGRGFEASILFCISFDANLILSASIFFSYLFLPAFYMIDCLMWSHFLKYEGKNPNETRAGWPGSGFTA